MFRVKICTALVTIHIHKLFTHSRTHHSIITFTEIEYGAVCRECICGNCLTFLVSGLDFFLLVGIGSLFRVDNVRSDFKVLDLLQQKLKKALKVKKKKNFFEEKFCFSKKKFWRKFFLEKILLKVFFGEFFFRL